VQDAGMMLVWHTVELCCFPPLGKCQNAESPQVFLRVPKQWAITERTNPILEDILHSDTLKRVFGLSQHFNVCDRLDGLIFEFYSFLKRIGVSSVTKLLGWSAKASLKTRFFNFSPYSYCLPGIPGMKTLFWFNLISSLSL
jgi:hypothetical protein